mmetsp:Transcript_36229/g.71222  ORF Transcript_36229/g.71222 Transcript_36229/m.71222 type:complete len:152 (+) Transcript_36229:25-480(+)
MEQPFVDHGAIRWRQLRQDWVSPVIAGAAEKCKSQVGSEDKKSSSSSSRGGATCSKKKPDTARASHDCSEGSPPDTNQPTQGLFGSLLNMFSGSRRSTGGSTDPVGQPASTEGDLDVQQVLDCCRTMRPFPEPVKLSDMVDILQVQWDDEN